MRSDIVPGAVFPDSELPDHTKTPRKVSELQGEDPLILTLARGHHCPKEHQQHLELAAFYPKIAVAYTRIATIATDEHHTLQEFRASVGAQWPFLSDAGRTVQKDLDIQERQPQGNKKQTNGGVILGLHFHGNTAVHAPLVPINSGVALRTCGQLYKNRALVTDNALVHVMLLSGTRRDRGFVLACWECSRKKIGELRLRILPGLGESRFDAGRIQLREGGELRSMFAVGDVRSGSVKRAAFAVGKGSIAIAAVHQVLHD